MDEKLEAHQDYTKWEFKSLHSKLDKFIESSFDKFATKEEHQTNKLAIEDIKSTHNKLMWWVLGTVWTISLWIIYFVIKTVLELKWVDL